MNIHTMSLDCQMFVLHFRPKQPFMDLVCPVILDSFFINYIFLWLIFICI